MYSANFKRAEYHNNPYANLPVVGEGLHSFVRRIDAIDCASQFNLSPFGTQSLVIAECYIPAGALFLQGFDDDRRWSYVSNCLKYGESATLFQKNKPDDPTIVFWSREMSAEYA